MKLPHPRLCVSARPFVSQGPIRMGVFHAFERGEDKECAGICVAFKSRILPFFSSKFPDPSNIDAFSLRVFPLPIPGVTKEFKPARPPWSGVLTAARVISFPRLCPSLHLSAGIITAPTQSKLVFIVGIGFRVFICHQSWNGKVI